MTFASLVKSRAPDKRFASLGLTHARAIVLNQYVDILTVTSAGDSYLPSRKANGIFEEWAQNFG
jgi:hypothetical protein